MKCDYSGILVFVDDPSSKKTVRLASHLAQSFDAKLSGAGAGDILAHLAFARFAGLDYFLVEKARDQILAQLSKSEAMFRSECGMLTGVEWRQGLVAPERFLSEQARIADLIVVRKDSDEDRALLNPLIDIGEVLSQAGRPVLIVPRNAEYVAAKNIVVAWNNSCEARRAVQDALPLLVRAAHVFVVAIADEPQGEDDVCVYLKGHDVSCTSVAERLTCDSVSDQLVQFAKQISSDLIVCGAYGHYRAAEWAFGGVTRDMLGRQDICCLMSH